MLTVEPLDVDIPTLNVQIELCGRCVNNDYPLTICQQSDQQITRLVQPTHYTQKELALGRMFNTPGETCGQCVGEPEQE